MRIALRQPQLWSSCSWFVPGILFLAGLIFAVRGILLATGATWVYAIDDPYIHMAMAKNLAVYGVYGVTPFEFSSSSSSPLWTLSLAGAFRLFGPHDGLPGLAAAGCAAAALYLADRLGRRLGLALWARWACNVCIVAWTPLVPLVATGMEHAAHLLACLALLLGYVSDLDRPGVGSTGRLCGLAALATGIRYETLFIVLPLGLSLFARKRRGSALLLVVSACLPVALYGLVSMAHGQGFLPTSLLLKGHFPAARTLREVFAMLGGQGLRALGRAPHLLLLMVPLAFAAWRPSKRCAHLRGLSLCLLGAVGLHLQFADIGWFYRYEAYLIPPLLLLAFAVVSESLSRGSTAGPRWLRLPAILLVMLCAGGVLAPACRRGVRAWRDVVPAALHVYREQYQIAQFIKAAYPPGVRIALNDLGALSYYPDSPHVLDLWGLGSFAVANVRRGQADSGAGLARLLVEFNPDLIVVYRDWFGDLLPASLIPVATWTHAAHYWNAGSVSLMATTPARAAILRDNLRRYESRLPASVVVRYDESARDARAPEPQS